MSLALAAIDHVNRFLGLGPAIVTREVALNPTAATSSNVWRGGGMLPRGSTGTSLERVRLFFLDNDVHTSAALSFASMPAC